MSAGEIAALDKKKRQLEKQVLFSSHSTPAGTSSLIWFRRLRMRSPLATRIRATTRRRTATMVETTRPSASYSPLIQWWHPLHLPPRCTNGLAISSDLLQYNLPMI
jgi:hypothetical protein